MYKQRGAGVIIMNDAEIKKTAKKWAKEMAEIPVDLEAIINDLRYDLIRAHLKYIDFLLMRPPEKNLAKKMLGEVKDLEDQIDFLKEEIANEK